MIKQVKKIFKFKSESGGSSITSLGKVEGGDASKAILRGRQSMTMDDGGSELHEENTKSLEDDEKGSDDEREESSTGVNYNEDKLRLRRLGLSQLLTAIRSKRSLFGVPLVGAKAAFKASYKILYHFFAKHSLPKRPK